MDGCACWKGDIMNFFTGPVNFRKAVSAWLATFLICGGLYWLLRPLVGEVSPWALPNIYVYISFTLSALASPVPCLTMGFDSLDSLAAWTAIGVTLASLVVLLLACRRGLSQWKVIGASMLVWGFGMLVWGNEFNVACPSMVLIVADLRSKAISEIGDPTLWWAAFDGGAFLLDFVLGLALLYGFDKLFGKASR